MQNKTRHQKSTKFANCPIVSCAACVGGERIAAVNDGAGAVKGGNKRLSSAAGSSFGASELSGSGDSVATTAPAPKSSNSIGLDDLLSVRGYHTQLPSHFLFSAMFNNACDALSSVTFKLTPHARVHCFIPSP